MYAIIETGGKQYRVKEGDVITVEKLNAEPGTSVKFDRVLVLASGESFKAGAPYIEGAAVEGIILESGKEKKVIIYKYKPKKNYRKKQGHRQPYTMVRIGSLGAESGKEGAEIPEAGAEALEAAAEALKTEGKTAEA